MKIKAHSFHLVDQSPWPFIASIRTIALAFGLVKWFHTGRITLILTRVTLIAVISFQWWRDISREGTFQGIHTSKVVRGLKIGIVLFITSEAFLFVSFFWAFFHRRLSPSYEIGLVWPPSNILPFNIIRIPLLNTAILLSSGVTLTWAHNCIIKRDLRRAATGIKLTILLAVYFFILQLVEYKTARFSIADSVYGASFFVITGFHGTHVLIGAAFLTVSLIRLINCQISNSHHLGFETAAWYWHFFYLVCFFLKIKIYL